MNPHWDVAFELQADGRAIPRDDRLVMWVITKRPRDFPDQYVVRAQWMFCGPKAPTGERPGGTLYQDSRCQLADTIEQARKLMPPNLYRMPPNPEDDPVIAEVWL
jgi:hypothetical protein